LAFRSGSTCPLRNASSAGADALVSGAGGRRMRTFTPPELVLCAIAVVGAIVGVVALSAGWITI